ncbi:MAG: AAA family ATPase [Lachnospiraceae bacterium]|nr:AAA family ATPase [Lachnospiraceae bacterium]
MKKISISNYGPIHDIELKLEKSMNVVIGPQASGKSTLGKSIYFCKKIRDYFVEYVTTEKNFINTHDNELYINFLKYIRRKYMGCFGTTKHLNNFEIVYHYGNKKKVMITLDKGFAYFKFSSELSEEIKKILYEVKVLYRSNWESNNPEYVLDFSYIVQFYASMRQRYENIAKILFEDDYEVLYIPAGRSLLSVLSDQLDVVDTSILDLPMQDFIERIRLTKKNFGTKLDSVVSNYLKTVQGQIKNANLDIAQELIHNILKADYVSNTDGERLYFDKERWVKLMYGSSGQQESLWILMLLFLIILENKKTYVIIEEPEAHLYPVSQKYMVELIALTMNSSASQVFITTHSPYILSSLNLLIQSSKVEDNGRLKGEETVIKRQLRISPSLIEAYKIDGRQPFSFVSITDTELGLINSMEIDTISDVINEETMKLIDLEIKYDL